MRSNRHKTTVQTARTHHQDAEEARHEHCDSVRRGSRHKDAVEDDVAQSQLDGSVIIVAAVILGRVEIGIGLLAVERFHLNTSHGKPSCTLRCTTNVNADGGGVRVDNVGLVE